MALEAERLCRRRGSLLFTHSSRCRFAARLDSGVGLMTELLVNVDVPDLPAAERFYCSAFLLKPGRRFGGDAVELIGASSKMYLLAKSAGTEGAAMTGSKRSYDRHWTPVHFDFVVDDLEKAVARSVAAGAAQEQSIRQTSWGSIAVMSDPFGHGYCLIKFSAPGYDAIATPPGA